MKLPVEIHIRAITTKELENAYKFDEVLSYCAVCNNYGKNYSCPDLSFNPLEYLGDYKYTTLILTEVQTDILKSHLAELSEKDLESQVQRLHMPDEGNDAFDLIAALAMKNFNVIKDIMSDELLVLESEFPGSLSSPPGSCTRCDSCTKAVGKPCRFPEKLRFSLESLGFLIPDLYQDYFGLELEWSKGGIPKAYHSCSALFHNEKINEVQIYNLLKRINYITI